MELRRMEWEDIVDVYELLRLDRISKYTGFPIDTLDSFLDYYHEMMEDDILYVLENDAGIWGLIQFHSFEDDRCELGYYMHPAYQKQGWMKKALLSLFESITDFTISLYIAQENLRSLRLAYKLGFKYISQGETMYLNDGKQHTIYVYERRF